MTKYNERRTPKRLQPPPPVGGPWEMPHLCYQVTHLNHPRCSSNLPAPVHHLQCAVASNQKHSPGSDCSCAAGHGCSQDSLGLRRRLLTTEQILPLIRNAPGRETPSQLATGLDMANNFSLKLLEEFMPGFLLTTNSKYYFPLVSKQKKKNAGSSNSKKKRYQSQNGELQQNEAQLKPTTKDKTTPNPDRLCPLFPGDKYAVIKGSKCPISYPLGLSRNQAAAYWLEADYCCWS